MKCPACTDAVLQMSERQGVEIDYCPTCRGIWLDRGELDKILDKESQTSSHSYERPSNHHDSHQKKNGYKKKKGSFLGDLFDF